MLAKKSRESGFSSLGHQDLPILASRLVTQSFAHFTPLCDLMWIPFDTTIFQKCCALGLRESRPYSCNAEALGFIRESL